MKMVTKFHQISQIWYVRFSIQVRFLGLTFLIKCDLIKINHFIFETTVCESEKGFGFMEREILIRFDSDSCEMTDIAALRNLMLDNGYKVREQLETKPGDMGAEMAYLILLVPIIPNVIKEIASILKLWEDSRHFKIKMEDKVTGRSVEIEGDKASVVEVLEKNLTYITNGTE